MHVSVLEIEAGETCVDEETEYAGAEYAGAELDADAGETGVELELSVHVSVLDVEAGDTGVEEAGVE